MATAAKTTSNTETTMVKLKLMIDKRANKVLFAEAEKDFVDILFNVLYMPFGSVTRLIADAGLGGCTGNLYKSLENLTEDHLIHHQTKVELLKPLLKWGKASVLFQPQACPRPVPDEVRKLYICAKNHRFVTNEINTRCPLCLRSFDNDKMRFEVQQLNIVLDTECGVVKKSFAYMVTDDLSVTPASAISATGLLQGKIKDIGALEERVVYIGPEEARGSSLVLELLNASMQTNEALTTAFLPHEEKVFGMETIYS